MALAHHFSNGPGYRVRSDSLSVLQFTDLILWKISSPWSRWDGEKDNSTYTIFTMMIVIKDDHCDDYHHHHRDRDIHIIFTCHENHHHHHPHHHHIRAHGLLAAVGIARSKKRNSLSPPRTQFPTKTTIFIVIIKNFSSRSSENHH